MTNEDLMRRARSLETRILDHSGADRLALQPEFSRVLERLRRNGAEVPGRLRRLESTLSQDAVEAMFDNIPV